MKTPDFRSILTHRGNIVSDGAFGPVLSELGVTVAGAQRELLNLDAPDVIRNIHARYLDSGATLILTNTFRANRYHLERIGAADRLRKINFAGVKLARDAVHAAGGAAWVFGRIGPLWMKKLDPIPMDEPERRAAYREQVDAILQGGPDGFLVETMMDLTEARLVILSIRECAPDLPVAASIRYRYAESGLMSPSGNPLHQCLHGLTHAGADIIGLNGTFPVDHLRATVPEIMRYCAMPVWVRIALATSSQSGRPRQLNALDEAIELAGDLKQHGVQLLGGDAGSTPDMIRRLADLMD